MTQTPEAIAERDLPRNIGNLHDGRKVCVLDMQRLHQNMLATFAHGCRTGVAVQSLDGYQSYRDLDAMVVVHHRQARTNVLQQELHQVRSRARNARKAAAEETEPEVRRDYQEDARHETKRAQQIEEELHRISQQSKSVIPLTFEGEVDFLLRGLSALFTSENHRVPASIAAALRTVLHELEFELEDGFVKWSAGLLVPADDRVFILGPFSGSVPMQGRKLTPAEIDELSASGGGGHRRRLVKEALMQRGYPKNLARAASLAPGGYLPKVLLGEEVVWPNCESTFDHLKFNHYLREVWQSHLQWGPLKYCQTNPQRQVLADLVAAMGGKTTVSEVTPLLVEMGILAVHIYSLTSIPGNTDSPVPAWPPSVERVGIWSRARSTVSGEMVSRMCPKCDKPATAVVRVLEVTEAILCRTCRVMPGNAELVFPPYYLDLALPATQIDAAWVAARKGLSE